MSKLLLTTVLLFSIITSFAQSEMKPVDELINREKPAWSLVKRWIDTAKNSIEVLPVDTVKSRDALYKTQVTTRSPMGAIIYKTGGLLIDSGWIRILGSGDAKLNRSLPEWNKGKTFKKYGEKPSMLLIADDAVGGFFALNGGGLGTDSGKVYYLSPDALKWEPLDISYTDFLMFCFNQDLDQFYGGLRWTNWKQEAAQLDGTKVYSFYPYLWSKEGKDINANQRKVIPVEEQYKFNIAARKKLGLDKKE